MIQRKSGEFNGDVDLSWSPKTQGAALLVLVAIDTAPTTAGSIEVIYNSGDGANYDTVVDSTDPSSPAATNVALLGVDEAVPLLRGDAVQVKYANADDRRVNVTILATDDYFIAGS